MKTARQLALEKAEVLLIAADIQLRRSSLVRGEVEGFYLNLYDLNSKAVVRLQVTAVTGMDGTEVIL